MSRRLWNVEKDTKKMEVVVRKRLLQTGQTKN